MGGVTLHQQVFQELAVAAAQVQHRGGPAQDLCNTSVALLAQGGLKIALVTPADINLLRWRLYLLWLLAAAPI